MKKLYQQSIFMLIILIISIPSQAQSLWGETASGMKPSKVIEIVKGSHLIQDGSYLGTGAKELIWLDDLRVVNESFKVSFFFIDEKLTQVTLSLNDERSFHLALRVFNLLTDPLRSKYGKELSRDIDTLSTFKKAEATWQSGRVNISLYLMAVDDSSAILNLNYQTRLSEEADKL